MRKLVALAMVLLLGACTCALAEEDVRVEIGGMFSIVRLADMEEVALNEDDAAEGLVYAATNDELELYVRLCDSEGQTKDELYEMYDDDFYDDVTVSDANGIEYLRYMLEEEVGVLFMISEDQYYEIVFYCVTDDAMAQAQAVLESIRML